MSASLHAVRNFAGIPNAPPASRTSSETPDHVVCDAVDIGLDRLRRMRHQIGSHDHVFAVKLHAVNAE